MKLHLTLLLLLVLNISTAQENKSIPANKQTVLNSILQQEKDLIGISDKVWSYAEIAMKEYQSAKTLSDYAEQQGFRVTRNIADIPTAFIAEYGSGKPIIGILGEFDALPEIGRAHV